MMFYEADRYQTDTQIIGELRRIRISLEERDRLSIAPTGGGKTLAGSIQFAQTSRSLTLKPAVELSPDEIGGTFPHYLRKLLEASSNGAHDNVWNYV